MELTSGHPVQLQPECSAPAVLLRLPQALKRALAAAQRSGQQIAFRCIQSGDSYQATLSVGATQHQFSGVSVDKQTLLRLSTLDDVPAAVVADIGCKFHQQRALHNSNIGSRIRASAHAEKQGRGQTQVLDRAPPPNGHKARGSATPLAVLQRPASMQPRPKTPPPVLERSTAVAAGSSRQQTQSQNQAQATRLLGRSLTPPNSRPSTPPPARQPQQPQQQAPVLQQQQHSRLQGKPVSKEPPKPRSLSSKLQQQQQRRTPPPASLQQQSHQRPATAAAAASRGGPSAALPLIAVAGEHASSTGQSAPAAAPRASPAPTAVPTAAPPPAAAQGKPAGALRSSSAGASTAAQPDRGTLGGSSAAANRPRSRGVSPAVGAPAAAAAKQQQARSAMPLISVQPLPQSAKAGDRRSPAPSGSTLQQQQQQQPPQRSRLHQGANNSRQTSAAGAAGKQQSAVVPAVAAASARPPAAAGQQPVQQQQTRKRLAPNNGGAANSGVAAGKAAKMRRLNDIVAPKAGQASGAAAVIQPGLRKASSQPQLHSARQQSAQPQRRASPSLPGVSGQRLSPDGSCSAGASPSQQQQHTKHWFTSSDESGGVCSVDGAAAGASKAVTGTAAASGAVGAKRKREPDSGLGGAVPPTQATTATAAVVTAVGTGTTHHSWAAAMQAKRQQSLQQAGKPSSNTAASGQTKIAVDPAAAKSSWQAALKRSPLHQAASAVAPAQQQQLPRTVSGGQAAASGQSVPTAEPASHAAAASQPPAAARAAAVLDLGPPGYSAVVDKEPRDWGAISNHQQYMQYTQLFNDLYSMYITLSSVIDANIRSVREAHEKMAAQSLGAPAHSEAKQQLQHLLTSRAELTRRHNSALHTLHKELAALKQHMQQWLVVRRAQAAAAVGGQVHCLPVDATAGGRQCMGGKGLMLAAAHSVPSVAVVGM